ncbi:MAG: hypothetical protein PHO89_01340 [Methylacidiphilaceae bacterium]|nr:hypothetical protein [Candidatus Methylacidiphilaceae bacterium]
MTQMQERNRDPLDDLLRRWHPEGHLPARFQREVWERVALRSREALPPARRSRGAWILFVAASLLAFLLATGQTHRWEEKRWLELKARYFQEIDPQALAAAQKTP